MGLFFYTPTHKISHFQVAENGRKFLIKLLILNPSSVYGANNNILHLSQNVALNIVSVERPHKIFYFKPDLSSLKNSTDPRIFQALIYQRKILHTMSRKCYSWFVKKNLDNSIANNQQPKERQEDGQVISIPEQPLQVGPTASKREVRLCRLRFLHYPIFRQW